MAEIRMFEATEDVLERFFLRLIEFDMPANLKQSKERSHGLQNFILLPSIP